MNNCTVFNINNINVLSEFVNKLKILIKVTVIKIQTRYYFYENAFKFVHKTINQKSNAIITHSNLT